MGKYITQADKMFQLKIHVAYYELKTHLLYSTNH